MALDSLSQLILSFSSSLDSYGAMEWNLRVVAVVTAFILVSVYKFAGKTGGIEWHGFLHALVTGIGGLACVYLDFYASVELTGKPGNFESDRKKEQPLLLRFAMNSLTFITHFIVVFLFLIPFQNL